MRIDSSKELILKTACDLFTLKGYNKTTFDDIAKLCHVTKQAITYHFGTKSALGRAVSHDYSLRLTKSFNAAVLLKVGKLDDLTLSAAYILWFSGYYRKDTNAFRFFDEFIFTDPYFDDVAVDEEDAYYSTFVACSDPSLSETEIKIKTVSAFYAGKGLLHLYSKGLIACDEDEFARYLYLNYFSPFISDEALLQRIYNQAKEILSIVDIIDIID